VSLLGIGKNRLARAEAGTPDLRCGTQERAASAAADSVRAFFHNAYTKLGECLPDKFVRRGRAKKQSKTKDKNDDSSDDWEVHSCEDDDADLREWLEKSSDTAVHNACVNNATLAKRWLPPGNLAEMYDHYQVVQSMLDAHAASSLVCSIHIYFISSNAFRIAFTIMYLNIHHISQVPTH